MVNLVIDWSQLDSPVGLLWDHIRTETYAAYGNACVCCGEDNPLFLTLDHVNNDGHLETVQGADLMFRLKRQGWPERIQLMCFNCNCGRARNGGVCPHE